MVSLLLASRANVNQDDRTGSTPLTAAAVTCPFGVVLLGAKITERNRKFLEGSNGLDR